MDRCVVVGLSHHRGSHLGLLVSVGLLSEATPEAEHRRHQVVRSRKVDRRRRWQRPGEALQADVVRVLGGFQAAPHQQDLHVQLLLQLGTNLLFHLDFKLTYYYFGTHISAQRHKMSKLFLSEIPIIYSCH